ncbi:flagellin N-terminal helical domain-containing protein [Sporosarcina ureae]|uniref:flagellin N-terminal helical domain-containing protein n=1 Tax=Sporosarcina ureae TaxID=1571 RepID=UPI0028B236A8|nr:flagellin [Sporosarcina ureae]
MRINHNIPALNNYRNQQQNSQNANESLKKLSSGMRINQAADDTAGLAISEKMRGQIRGLEQAKHNIKDGISLAETADAALGNINDPMLLRLRELAVQAANDTLTDEDRQLLQLEVTKIKQGIDQIANNTEFNTIPLLNRTSEVAGAAGVTVINGSETQLTSTIDYDTQPSWKGENIAFTRGNDVFLMNTDGSNQQLIVTGASQPALSEDGKSIAYVKDGNLFVSRVDGTDIRQLTTDSNVPVDQTFGSRPAWSANSDRVLFKSGNGIESISLNDSSRTVVLSDGNASSPSITADGKQIVYQSTNGIFSLNIDTSTVTSLSAVGTEPRLSPDGKAIAFSALSSESHDSELFVMNIDGSGKTDITSKMDTASWHSHNIYPSWSPDGKFIVFHSDNVKDPSTSGDIWRVELSGTTTDINSEGTGTMLLLQVGANAGQNMKVILTDARTSALGISNLNITSREEAEKAISLVDQAVQKISSERSKYGSYQNVLQHIEKNVANYHENILSSESRIRDTDMSKEITQLTGHQTLLQASQAMLVQANQMTQGILQLLK